jgi:hypothetical protein
MANHTSGGGKKQGSGKPGEEKKHVGVRPGSTARKKDRTNQEARKKIVPDAKRK